MKIPRTKPDTFWGDWPSILWVKSSKIWVIWVLGTNTQKYRCIYIYILKSIHRIAQIYRQLPHVTFLDAFATDAQKITETPKHPARSPCNEWSRSVMAWWNSLAMNWAPIWRKVWHFLSPLHMFVQGYRGPPNHFPYEGLLLTPDLCAAKMCFWWWFYGLFFSNSPSNHHLGEYEAFSKHLMQIQDWFQQMNDRLIPTIACGKIHHVASPWCGVEHCWNLFQAFEANPISWWHTCIFWNRLMRAFIMENERVVFLLLKVPEK